MPLALQNLLCLVVAYLVGSICSAIITSQLFHLPDPRLEGSQNPGATNVLRLAGTKFALIVLFTDGLKGALPVMLATGLGLNTDAIALTGLAAVLGHIYPVFFAFKGGKGVATALGALLAFQPWLGGLVTLTWLICAIIGRYSSLASLIAMGAAPFYALLCKTTSSGFFPLLAITGMIFYQHRENIKRLWRGTESKINLKKRVSQK
jgi:glycerol-3-phosphate acyltransferase PlsY